MAVVPLSFVSFLLSFTGDHGATSKGHRQLIVRKHPVNHLPSIIIRSITIQSIIFSQASLSYQSSCQSSYRYSSSLMSKSKRKDICSQSIKDTFAVPPQENFPVNRVCQRSHKHLHPLFNRASFLFNHKGTQTPVGERVSSHRHRGWICHLMKSKSATSL